MIQNTKYKTFPFLLHYPLAKTPTNQDRPLLDFSKKSLIASENFWGKLIKNKLKKCSIPDDLTVVTWNNLETKGMLQVQLEEYGIDYLLLGKNIEWPSNRLKIKLLLDNFNLIKTNYILCLDCYDVFILKDLKEILSYYKSFGKKIIFNATGAVYPFCEEDEKKESVLCDPPFCYFNSGMFIGEKDYIEKVYSKLDLTSLEFPRSDQYLIRKIYHSDDNIVLDFRCNIFQVSFLPDEKIQYYLKTIESGRNFL